MFRLFLHFHWALLSVNLPISLGAGLLGMALAPNKVLGLINGFSLLLMTGGFLLSYYFFDQKRSHQYFLYYNRGLSKLHLLGASYAANLVLVLLLFALKVAIYA